MRRRDHPSRANAMTFCFSASLKTLLMPTKVKPSAGVNVQMVFNFNEWPVLDDSEAASVIPAVSPR